MRSDDGSTPNNQIWKKYFLDVLYKIVNITGYIFMLYYKIYKAIILKNS